LRTETALAVAAREIEPTTSRFMSVASLLGTRYRGSELRPRTRRGAELQADRHLHALFEIAWTLAGGVAEMEAERLARFADLTVRLVQIVRRSITWQSLCWNTSPMLSR
jgi:hypothetical protein